MRACLSARSRSPIFRRRHNELVERLPTIALDFPNVAPSLDATVQFTTAIYGIHAAGTVYRMDEVPIPVRQLLETELPTDEDVLRAIANRVG